MPIVNNVCENLNIKILEHEYLSFHNSSGRYSPRQETGMAEYITSLTPDLGSFQTPNTKYLIQSTFGQKCKCFKITLSTYGTTLSVQNGAEKQVTRNVKLAYTCTSGECTEDLQIISCDLLSAYKP